MTTIEPRVVAELARAAGPHQLRGDASVSVDHVAALSEAGPRALTWMRAGHVDVAASLASCVAACIVMHVDERHEPRAGQAFLLCENPRMTFARILRAVTTTPFVPGIHPTAVIAPDAQLHPQVSIGPYAVIGRCVIGEGSVIDSHVRLHDGTVIGRRVRIAASTVIGGEGYGYVTDEQGMTFRFPHLGHVVIEDDVEIGANTCIDRGTLGVTRIGCGAKIDNLVHIAHNVSIGAGAMIVAHAMIGGSTRIGERAWVAPNATVRDGLSVGDAATVGLGAVLVRSMPTEAIWFGNPARPASAPAGEA